MLPNHTIQPFQAQNANLPLQAQQLNVPAAPRKAPKPVEIENDMRRAAESSAAKRLYSDFNVRPVMPPAPRAKRARR